MTMSALLQKRLRIALPDKLPAGNDDFVSRQKKRNDKPCSNVSRG